MFQAFSEAVHKRYNDMKNHELFVVDTEDLFTHYLLSFPEGTNNIYRERTEHDCSCCKNFIRHLGTLVAIVDGVVQTVWDVEGVPYPYDVVASRLADIVRQAPIKTVFRSKERGYGTESNYDGKTNQKFYHFHGKVTGQHFHAQPDTKRGEREATAQVLRRGLTELTASALETAIDMIETNSVYRGAEFLSSIKGFQELHKAYQGAADKDLFVWSNLDKPNARFRNTAIGTFVIDISEGMDPEKAAEAFGRKLDPIRYKRPTAVITPKMIEAAVMELQGLGLEGAIERRFAKISDVSVNNVLFVDNSVKAEMKDGIAGLLMEAVTPAQVDIKNAQPITAEEFFSTIVPQSSSIEVLVENKHAGNFVSLTAPVHENTKRLFKWGNDFAWSYDGEVTDSIKQRVKAAGGNTDAKLRVSLAWFNYDDLDIHAICPDGDVFFGSKAGSVNGGNGQILDVDMNAGTGRSRAAVENLSWKNPKDGDYKIWINQYFKRENIDFGFTLEFEGFGRLEQFSYDKAVAGDVQALTFRIKNGQLTEFIPASGLKGGSQSVDMWGVKTQTLVPVDTLMASPNHWDGEETGNKHWFFLLKGCKNPNPARGIYNEFLRNDLEKHRKVFEVLGSKTKCPPSDEQLSGLGFSSTRGDSVTVVAKGPKMNRALQIQF